MSKIHRKHPPKSGHFTLSALVAGMTLSNPVLSQEASGPAPAWQIKPRAALNLTYTDNVNLAPSALAKDDLSLQAIPGISLDGKTKRLTAHFDYELAGKVSTESGQGNDTQNRLNAFGTLEAIDNWLFLDANASISQQSLSAFRASATQDFTQNANSTETRNLSLSPYIKGRLLNHALYEARYRLTTNRSDSSTSTSNTTSALSGNIASSIANTKLGWLLDYSNTANTFDGAGNTPDTRESSLKARLTYRLSPQLDVAAGLIRTRNDFAQPGTDDSNGLSFGLNWNPTERTQLSLNSDDRGYATTYDFSLSHRLPLSEVRYTLNRGATTRPTSLTYAGYGGLFDLLFSQLTSKFPDPVARAQETSRLLGEYGLDPSMTNTGEYLQNQVSLQTRHSLTLIKRGARNVLTVTLSKSDTEAFSNSTLPLDPTTGATQVKQDSINTTLSHKLSPKSNVSLNLAYVHSTSDSASNVDTEQKTVGLNFSSSLGKNTTYSVGVTHNAMDGNTANNYTANTLTVLFNHRF